jgi:hypothetical protein
MDVGNNLTATVSGLIPGATYFFAVTAYDNAGLESTFSGQISYTVPATAPRPLMLPSLFIAQNSSGLSVLSGIGPAGYAYDIYASMDFSSWLAVGTVTMDSSGMFQFTDGNSYGIHSRFYRLKQNTP